MDALIRTVCPWIVASLWAVIAVHVVMCWRLIVALVRHKPRRPPATSQRAMVVLCLRGDDPYLETTLRAALALDYPDYHVKIIIDHRQDPAWTTVHRVLGRWNPQRVSVEFLESRRPTCSLKCSALLQALRGTPNDVECIALLDADVVPHASWLTDLLTPLADTDVAVTTGNRWYMPHSATLSSMLRYMWNAGAVSQMYSTGIPWGGSMAFSTSLMRDTGLLEKLERAFCEDTMVGETAKRTGKRVEFVPEAVMINTEDCRLLSLFGWISRQLLNARLYHSGWRCVFWLGIVSFATFLLNLGTLATAAWVGAWEPFTAVWSSTIAAVAILGAEVVAVDWAVRRLVRKRGKPAGRWSPRTIAYGVAAFLTVPVLYSIALLRAAQLKEVDWRGIQYRVNGPFQVVMQGYRRYQRPALATPRRVPEVTVAGVPLNLATTSVARESIF